jgi:hypothetical protein
MGGNDTHVEFIEKKITALSAALADLGRGTNLRELLKIIRFPGYTTPAELTLTAAILDSMSTQVNQLAKLDRDLLAGSKQIVEK